MTKCHSCPTTIVPPSPFPVHADLDVILDEHLRESHAGELRALVHTALEPMARGVRY